MAQQPRAESLAAPMPDSCLLRATTGADLNCAMVRSGVALRWQRYWRDHCC